MTVRSEKLPPRFEEYPLGRPRQSELMLWLIKDLMAESPIRSAFVVQALLDEHFKAVEE